MNLRNLFAIVFVLLIITGLEAETLTYQGRLTDSNGTAVNDSSYNLDFFLFDDSLSGDLLWFESASVTTHNGLFSYQLGTINELNAHLLDHTKLFLEIWVSGEQTLPRIRISETAKAIISRQLIGYDSSGYKAIETDNDGRSFSIYDSTGNEIISLNNKGNDSSVVLPDSSINSDEILNESGITVSINTSEVPLTIGDMQDMITITLEIPEDGYITLTGKCYLELSGTTGANQAIVQIDDVEGGSSKFPYYTQAGLSGYVNSGSNYFPIFVTRTFYKTKGFYTFRMEGRAIYDLPAQVSSWDHVLNAVYIPTSYYAVEAVVSNPGNLTPLETIRRENKSVIETGYKIDLKLLETEK